MTSFLTAFLVIAGLFAGILGTNYVSVDAAMHYELAFTASLLLSVLGFLLFTKGTEGPYRLDSFSKSLWLFVLVITMVHATGGYQFRYNMAAVLAVTTLVGLTAHPYHSIYLVAVLFVSTLVFIANSLNGFLPGTHPLPITDVSGFILSIIYPVLNIILFQVLLLGFKRSALPARLQSGMNSFKAKSTMPGMDPAKLVAAQRTPTVVMGNPTDPTGMEDSSVTQIFSRVYMDKQGAQALEGMKDILNTVVYFMSRNFKAYTSIGFLASEMGDKLVINSVVTKSGNLDYDTVIEFGKGIVGSSVSKPGGFVTGNLKSYPEQLEYYSTPENINSIMIMRVMDNQSKRLQGLLVVDSDHVRAFTDEHKELLNRFTQIASAMITNARLTYQMNKHAKWADIQYEISKRLSEALKPEDIVEVLLQSLSKTFDFDRLIICNYNAETSKGSIWKLQGDPGGLQQGMEFDINNRRSLYGSIFRNRKAMVSQGFREEGEFFRFDFEEPTTSKPQDILIAPIHDDRQAVLAVVGMESNRPGAYSQVELQLLKTLMANVSTALTKARMYNEMEKLATMDGLTQIANHRKFQDIMSSELERCHRYNTGMTLLLMDIDHFKKFNDTYGHPVGDLVLQNVAKALQSSIRNTDYCARYGGEEFVVVLIQSDEEQSKILSERIRKAIEDMEVKNEDKLLKVTVSIGSASFPADAASKQELIDNADKAMYHSKENGRNRVSFFSQVRTAAEKSR